MYNFIWNNVLHEDFTQNFETLPPKSDKEILKMEK